jgi:hypothetical protein
MRTRTTVLLLAPLFMLASACADQLVTEPQGASFATTAGDATVGYDAIILPAFTSVPGTAGGSGAAADINDFGIIAGFARDAMGSDLALRWVATSTGASGPEALGALPPPFDGHSRQIPLAMNNAGLVVGYVQTSGRFSGFVYDDENGMQLLPQAWQFLEAPSGVNDQGMIVGTIDVAIRDADGVVVGRRARGAVSPDLASTILLPPLAGHSESRASAINTDGLITGGSRAGSGPWVGVTWRIDGAGMVLEGPDEIMDGFFPGALNSTGDMLATAIPWSETGVRAVLRNGSMLALDPLQPGHSVYANGISDEVGGTVRVVGSSGSRAVLWTVNANNEVSGPVDLGVPSNNTTWASARGVNRYGWIVGSTHTKAHNMRPTLWLPRSSGNDGDDGGECKPHPRHKDRCL